MLVLVLFILYFHTVHTAKSQEKVFGSEGLIYSIGENWSHRVHLKPSKPETSKLVAVILQSHCSAAVLIYDYSNKL